MIRRRISTPPRRKLPLAPLAFILLVHATATTAVIPISHVRPCAEEWTLMEVPPDASDMVISDADLLSPTEGWAVGHHAKGAPSPLTAHWDGAQWRIISDREAGPPGSSLNAVAARSVGDVWAVGYRETSSFNRFAPLAQQWDGSAWRDRSPPPMGDSSVLIDAAADLTGLWAVGFSLTGSTYSPLVQRWDGTSWATTPTPSLASDSGVLLSIASVGPLDAWAVGYRKDRWRYETLIEHWDGNEWSIVPSPNPAGNQALLTGIAASPSGAWAVGYSTWGSTYRTLAQRWDGSRWEIVPSVDPHPQFNVFRDVIDGLGTGAWAVGVTQSGTQHTLLLEHWDGITWDTKQIEGVSGTLLGGSALETGHGVLVGHLDGRPLILGTCFDPQTPSVDQSPDRWIGGKRGDEDGDTEPVAPTGSSPGQDSAEAVTTSSEVEEVVIVDEAVPAGISEQTETWGAAVTDLYHDGWSDFFLGRHGKPGRLYRNEEGHFVEVAPGTFTRSDRHGCVWIDWNRDHLDDLYCALGAERGYEIKANELWTQRADGGFTNHGATLGAADPFGRGRDAVTLDANGDGLTDLFVANLETRPDGLPTPDRLFINTGKGFRTAPWFGLDVEDGGICARDGDVNNDGLTDLLVCSRLSGLRVYANAGSNRFIDVSAQMMIPPDPHVRDALLADFDSDAVLDLAAVTRGRIVVRIQKSGAFEKEVRYRLTRAVAIASGDVNDDGHPDLYVVRRGVAQNVPDVLLLNDGTGTGFTEVSIPQAADGSGEDVVSLDYNRNGHADFIVLNGYQQPGSIQLLSSYPAA